MRTTFTFLSILQFLLRNVLFRRSMAFKGNYFETRCWSLGAIRAIRFTEINEICNNITHRNVLTSEFKEKKLRTTLNFNSTTQMFKNLAIVLLTCWSGSGLTQFNFQYNDSIPVFNGTLELDMPWVGGLNHAQFSEFDYDFDGQLDLFVFDRSSDNILVFLQKEDKGTKFYDYLPNAQSAFPNQIRYWAKLVDYDNDGRKDLFCSGLAGITVYRNVGDALNGLQWVLTENLVQADNWGTMLTLFVSTADIPGIEDVDGDGDKDILTFHLGGEYLQYFKNLSMETYGVPDSLNFKLMNECWGIFREDLNTNFIYLNDNTAPCGVGNIPSAESPQNEAQDSIRVPTEQTPKHSGSTVMIIDIDDSGVMDLILGDASYSSLTLLVNGGTAPNTNSPMVSFDLNFPSTSTNVNLDKFPAGFFVDANFDGINDLLVGTNAKNASENETSVLFYKNDGTNELPVFEFEQDGFLQNQMIEHGTGSSPVLADINNDGLLDLFVANQFRYLPGEQKQSSVAYYQNTGTTSDPEFSLVTANFAGLSDLTLGLNLKPTFGDLNDDGLLDLIVGREDGTLSYFQNTSVLPSINFAAPINNYQDNLNATISAGQHAAPQLFDLNNDGLVDLIIGKKTGELMYYQNVGTVTNPSFQLVNSLLGEIDIAIANPDGYAYPHFFSHDDTTYLFLGNLEGTLRYYKNIDDNLFPGNAFQFVSSNFLGISSGAHSSFFVKDIDDDGNLNLFVGHDLGGIHHFENDPSSGVSINNLTIEQRMSVYPNPTKDVLTVLSDLYGECQVELIDVFGNLVLKNQSFQQRIDLPLTELATGVYMLKISSKEGASCIKRIVKQ